MSASSVASCCCTTQTLKAASGPPRVCTGISGGLGTIGLVEGIWGYDLLTNEEIDGEERAYRFLMGTASLAGTTALIAGGVGWFRAKYAKPNAARPVEPAPAKPAEPSGPMKNPSGPTEQSANSARTNPYGYEPPKTPAPSTPTPVAPVATSTQSALTTAAQKANTSTGAGRGPVHGTKVHTAFEAEVNALRNANLTTEVSYLNGVRVRRGTPGAVRLDVVEGPVTAPTAIYDLKTGSAKLTPARIAEIQKHVPGGTNVPVIEIR